MSIVVLGCGLSPFSRDRADGAIRDWVAEAVIAAIQDAGIDKAQIEAYAAWLSELGNTTYRLPTAAEWEHAANAGGRQPKRDFNCTVLVGTQQLKGLSMLSVKSGKENGWGLVNYIGNVQELVTAGAGLQARGGSFKNKLQNCRIELSVNHNGQGDEVTGFRLVRQVEQ